MCCGLAILWRHYNVLCVQEWNTITPEATCSVALKTKDSCYYFVYSIHTILCLSQSLHGSCYLSQPVATALKQIPFEGGTEVKRQTTSVEEDPNCGASHMPSSVKCIPNHTDSDVPILLYLVYCAISAGSSLSRRTDEPCLFLKSLSLWLWDEETIIISEWSYSATRMITCC